MRPLKPQTRFLLRASVLLAAWLSLWWFALLNPMLAQSQFGAQGYPVQNGALFGQIGSGYGQIGPMLAPQSWIGQPGPYGAHAVGQIHPLMSQLAGRGFGAGIF